MPLGGLCVWLFLGNAPAEAAAHAGSPCALAGACGLGFLLPDSIDFDHVVQVMSARLLHGQVALSPFVFSKIFWDRYFETM